MNVFAPDGLVGRWSTTGTWAKSWSYYVFDQQGNVDHRTDATGGLRTSSVYDAYGLDRANAGKDDPFGYNGRWGYYRDVETGLYLCQHRYYDPSTGRWLTRDPIGYAGGIGLYGYCRSRPSSSDPAGTSVTICTRPLKDFMQFFFTIGDIDRYVGPVHHFVGTSLCGTVGYGPEGGYSAANKNETNNFGNSIESTGAECFEIPTTPEQEACICSAAAEMADDEAKKFGPYRFPVATWRGYRYNPLTHNCQTFVVLLVEFCHIAYNPCGAIMPQSPFDESIGVPLY